MGAGSIGSVIGGHLAEAGYDVTLIDVWREHIDTINKNGLHIYGVSGDRLVRVKAATPDMKMEPMDYIILSVKAYDTRRALASASHIIKEDTCILSIQNGIIPIEDFIAAGEIPYILRGVTNHGATLMGPGKVYHAGRGKTYIGCLTSAREKAIEMVEIFNNSGLEAEYVDNIDSILWSKLVVNIAINPLTAIARCRNGDLLSIQELMELMDMAIGEALKIAGALGIKLLYEDAYNHVRSIARMTANNKSSMLQDIERGRKTEVDYLNGVIVKYGEELGIDTPVNRVLLKLIKSIEMLSQKS